MAMAGGFGLGWSGIFGAFMLWFLARAALKLPIRYGKALEVAGLASVVAVIGNVAVVALTVNFTKTFSGGDRRCLSPISIRRDIRCWWRWRRTL